MSMRIFKGEEAATFFHLLLMIVHVKITSFNIKDALGNFKSCMIYTRNLKITTKYLF